MFAFFDSVLEFFKGIGRIFSLMWDAVTGFFTEVGGFFTNVVGPIITTIPKIIGTPLAVGLLVTIVLLVGLTIWEIIN